MRLRDGVVLNLHETEPYKTEALSQQIRRKKDFFEADILEYISSRYPRHNVIIDVGANIGNHTVYFAKYLHYDAIVAIEPIDANYAILMLNISPYENIVAAHVAVGDHEGFTSMLENHTNMGNSKVAPGGPLNIPLTTIDKFKFWNVTLIKIDVEGYEPEVLRGAKETIAKYHPLILLEDGTGGSYKDLLPVGYEVERFWEKEFTYLYKWTL